MIEKAINKILSLAKIEILDIDDRPYTDRKVYGIKDPEPKAIVLHTLQGLIDWVEADRHEDLMLHVVGPRRVDAISKLRGEWEQRNDYVEVSPLSREGFPFEHYMTVEDFIIKFQCGFVDSPNKTKVLKEVSAVRGSEVVTATDDGISQKVHVEAELQRLEETTLEPMIALAPFRTFTEVMQPESLFLLRLKQRKDELPAVALYEADGGAWQNVAITNIADFLKDSAVVKEDKIPVLS